VDPRLLQHYERELRHVREMGAEFAQQYPKIAGRLGLEGLECADPYVERLLEAFGFLAARVQLKLEDEFPQFTQHLLELVYPHYLAPTPSMVVARFVPNAKEGSLAGGFTVPRDSCLRGRKGRDDPTACEYRTRHPVELWPIELVRAEYTTLLSGLSGAQIPSDRPAKAMLRLQLCTTSGVHFDQLGIDRLPLFLAGNDEIAMRLYEQLIAASLVVMARPAGQPASALRSLPEAPSIRALGFADEDAMLPYGPRSFQGYRLLHEYFAFPARYMFVEIAGLSSAVRECASSELELLILLEQASPSLEGAVSESRVQLFCAPAINLFSRQADRIHVSHREAEHHVVPDRTRPMDLEVHTVTQVVGHGSRAGGLKEFLPMYAARDDERQPTAYYTTTRKPRALSSRQREHGPRSTYVGSEVFLSLVDEREPLAIADLRQLAVSALCTNRDLPLHMPLGQADGDFTLQSGAPISAIRCVAGPSEPRASHANGDLAWRLISHLSLNYVSLMNDGRNGATVLREMLSLYAELGEAAMRKQIDGVGAVHSRAAVRPMPGPGPLTFGRGLEITLECDESNFQGTGVFLLGSVLERFFARYTSINSFTETVLRTTQRGEIMRWPTTSGQRHTI
jgi:type VI secretion system protein ImpG